MLDRRTSHVCAGGRHRGRRKAGAPRGTEKATDESQAARFCPVLDHDYPAGADCGKKHKQRAGHRDSKVHHRTSLAPIQDIDATTQDERTRGKPRQDVGRPVHA